VLAVNPADLVKFASLALILFRGGGAKVKPPQVGLIPRVNIPKKTETPPRAVSAGKNPQPVRKKGLLDDFLDSAGGDSQGEF
jgi:hypothetical protein